MRSQQTATTLQSWSATDSERRCNTKREEGCAVKFRLGQRHTFPPSSCGGSKNNRQLHTVSPTHPPTRATTSDARTRAQARTHARRHACTHDMVIRRPTLREISASSHRYRRDASASAARTRHERQAANRQNSAALASFDSKRRTLACKLAASRKRQLRTACVALLRLCLYCRDAPLGARSGRAALPWPAQCRFAVSADPTNQWQALWARRS